MSNENGGPAFPVQGYEGLTMRDYFAAQAMQGDWAAQSSDVGTWENHIAQSDLIARAETYYRIADAMLVARNN